MSTLNEKISELKSKRVKLEQRENSILSQSGELMTPDQQTEHDAVKAEMATVDLQIDTMEDASKCVVPRSTGTIPAVARQPHGLKCFSSEKNALDFGKYLQSLTPKGIAAGMVEGTNSAGGFLVPTELASDLIRLVEERGTFRKESRLVRT